MKEVVTSIDMSTLLTRKTKKLLYSLISNSKIYSFQTDLTNNYKGWSDANQTMRGGEEELGGK